MTTEEQIRDRLRVLHEQEQQKFRELKAIAEEIRDLETSLRPPAPPRPAIAPDGPPDPVIVAFNNDPVRQHMIRELEKMRVQSLVEGSDQEQRRSKDRINQRNQSAANAKKANAAARKAQARAEFQKTPHPRNRKKWAADNCERFKVSAVVLYADLKGL
jgi:hypothetical protein